MKMMINKTFYDTCAILQNDISKEENGVISIITLQELEHIKSSKNKTEELRYQARVAIKQIVRKCLLGEFKIIIFPNYKLQKVIKKFNFLDNNDAKIIATGYLYQKKNKDKIRVSFYTNDSCCLSFAQSLEGFDIRSDILAEPQEEYHGYKTIKLSEEELAEFYENAYKDNNNIYDLLENEYLILSHPNGTILDKYVWRDNQYEKVKYSKLKSAHFGEISPKDDYQQMAIDSFIKNDITLIGGPPGSGKTYLALGYLFQQLEKGEIDRIIVFCNPVVTRDAAKLGFYPGTVIEKLLSTQVGAVLTSKLGSVMEVEKLIADDKLVLIPVGDARGYEVPQYSGVYILESQNLTADLLRLILQRVGEKSKVIVDGDRLEQVDVAIYAGSNNGMRKMSEVFKGKPVFGQVDLNSIYRSIIADIASKM